MELESGLTLNLPPSLDHSGLEKSGFIGRPAGRGCRPTDEAPQVLCCRSRCVVSPRCRSRWQNAHVTEERGVLYPWHPWFGLTVHVHVAIERRGTSTFRCSLDGRVTGR